MAVVVRKSKFDVGVKPIAPPNPQRILGGQEPGPPGPSPGRGASQRSIQSDATSGGGHPGGRWCGLGGLVVGIEEEYEGKAAWICLLCWYWYSYMVYHGLFKIEIND